jgi:hypothetical protein
MTATGSQIKINQLRNIGVERVKNVDSNSPRVLAYNAVSGIATCSKSHCLSMAVSVIPSAILADESHVKISESMFR